MHNTQVATPRLETTFATGSVFELAPSTGAETAPKPILTEPIPFEQVHEKVQRDDKGKWDVVLPRSDVLMQNGKILFPDAKFYECQDGITPSTWALGQICQRLNIPTSYFRRCPAHLQDAQFNWWNAKPRNQRCDRLEKADAPSHSQKNGGSPFEDEAFECESISDAALNTGEPSAYQNGFSNGSGNGHKFRNGIYAGTEKSEYWLLRSKGEVLRAILTDKYTPLDNRTLLDSLQKSLPAHLQVQWLALDDESFHLRIIDPRMTKEILSDDPLMAGLHIANSEVGRRSVSVDVMVWRQVCSNGLIKLVRGKNLLCQRHVSVSPHHFTALLKQSLSSALAHAQDFMERLEWATTEPIREVETEMKILMQHYYLSQSFTDQVKTALQNERSDQQSTVFGLTNALTAAAQSLDAEQRYDVEVLAGKLLERRWLQNTDGSPRSRQTRVPKALLEANASEANTSEANSSNASEVSEAVEAAEVLFEAERVDPTKVSGATEAEAAKP